MEPLKEGEDYVITASGRLMFTAAFLTKRGYCCGAACHNCPYNYAAVPEPKKTTALQLRQQRNDEATRH